MSEHSRTGAQMRAWHEVGWLVVITSLVMPSFYVCAETAPALTDNIKFLAPAVAYSPRNYSPDLGTAEPRAEQVAADLRLLRSAGFRSLLTYGSQGALGSIPELARENGFDGLVIMGLWDPTSQEEWRNALAAASFVDGFCLGNEGLGHRYETTTLSARMSELRKATGKPVTTSERIEHYLQGPYRALLLEESDWLFPNAHPVWHGQLNPEHAANWIVVRYDFLTATSGRRVIIKEAGFPSSGSEGVDEFQQVRFFEFLGGTSVPFFHFEAFDQTWKQQISDEGEIEGHWGIFDPTGNPKEVVLSIRERWSEK